MSQCIVSQCLLVSDGDLERSKFLGPALWPVLLTLYLGPLHQVRYHDNGGGPSSPARPASRSQPLSLVGDLGRRQYITHSLTTHTHTHTLSGDELALGTVALERKAMF